MEEIKSSGVMTDIKYDEQNAQSYMDILFLWIARKCNIISNRE